MQTKLQVKMFIIVFFALFSITYYFFNFLPKRNLEKRIGFMLKQMIMTGFEDKDLLYNLKKDKAGGYIIFSRNARTKEQLLRVIDNIKSRKIKLIAVDNEGGGVNRFKEIDDFKNMPFFSNLTKMTESSRIAAHNHFAEEMKEIGVTVNFTPVVDLHINKDPEFFMNKVGRIISDDPKEVTKLASEVVNSYRKSNIITSLKHFPGHGSAMGDTHTGFVDISNTWDTKELEPYISLIKNKKADMIMIGHIFNKNLDALYPASLSYNIITQLLRNEMGYNGVIISDAIDMRALSLNFSLEEIVIRSINAGTDIILHANSLYYDRNIAGKIYNIMLNAVYNKNIPEERIYESYHRVSKLIKDYSISN